MNEWKKTSIELPPKDGFYEVRNSAIDYNIAYYDGLGFLFYNVYRIPDEWKEFSPRVKRYGPVPKDEEIK